MNEKTAILHVGLPKTGTTSIQSVFYENRQYLLLNEKILYPSIEANHSHALRVMFLDDPRTHLRLRLKGITGIHEANKIKERYKNQLEREINMSNWTRILFSAEGVSNLNNESLNRLKGWGDQFVDRWSILIWLRNPIEHVRSSIQQHLKSGAVLEQLYENPPLSDWKRVLDQFINIFGLKNIFIGDFDRSVLEPGGIVANFVELLEVTSATKDLLVSTSQQSNESMSLIACHILSSLNRQLPLFVNNEIGPYRSGKELRHIKKIKGEKFDIPLSVKEKCLALSKNNLDWVKGKFGLDLHPSLDKGYWDPSPIRSQASIDSLALLVAELSNDKYFQQLMREGNKAMKEHRYLKAYQCYKEARRLYPHQPVAQQLFLKAEKFSQNADISTTST